MDLIKDINNTAREKEAVEAAIEETQPQETDGKSVSDYLSDIQQDENK